MKLSLDSCLKGDLTQILCEFYEGKNSHVSKLKNKFGNDPLNGSLNN